MGFQRLLFGTYYVCAHRLEIRNNFGLLIKLDVMSFLR